MEHDNDGIEINYFVFLLLWIQLCTFDMDYDVKRDSKHHSCNTYMTWLTVTEYMCHK